MSKQIYILVVHKYEGYQFGNHNMFCDDLSNANIIDVQPNFNLKNGSGRIITHKFILTFQYINYL